MSKVHFIGIGGIGISAIARMMLLEGREVSGSDQAASPVTAELASLGVKINFGHTASNLPAGTELVVYTIAISPDNPELLEAKHRQLPVFSYPEMLGRISADKYTIAVSGTHGKTTTTAMLAKIFSAAGLDPTVVVGSWLKDSQSNFIAGRGKYFIAEACEYRRSFLNLNPRLVIVTNIDNDHLDYYRDLAAIESAFAELVAKVPPDGFLVCDRKSPRLEKALAAARCQVVDYGAVKADFKLLVPGEHNVSNARAALAAATAVGVNPEVALGALNQFQGTWRRFEYRGRTKKGALVYDDYGHHPSEIKATLAGARSVSQGKIYVAFQPHLYSRTKLLFNDFARSFAAADRVLILPIYAAREAFDPEISIDRLASAISESGTPTEAVNSFDQAAARLTDLAGPNDLILTLGAGDVFQIGERLL